jgi:CubicO group peptidase (beta-lactamase class C family)
VRYLPGRRAAETVAECFATANRKGGYNSDYNPDALGKFYYNGGHFQKLAMDMGLGADNNAALAADIQQQLGSDIQLTYGSPQLAGGVNTTAASYAVFLRKILNRQLYIGDLLGSHAVCSNPETCSSALHTPVPEDLSWDYSLGHWVETDPESGDGAFSSAGAFGFYPWIDASKTWYGIVARKGQAGSGQDSARCGGEIRRAWITGESRL